MQIYSLEPSKARKELEEYLNYTYNYFIDEIHDVFELSKSKIKKLPIEENFSTLGGLYLSDQDLIVKIGLGYGNQSWNCCENCWEKWLLTRGETLAHELGHYFHMLANEDYWINRAKIQKFDRNHREYKDYKECWFLGELIADSASFLYFHKINLLEKILDYNNARDCTNNIERIVFNIFENKIKNIEILIKNLIHEDFSGINLSDLYNKSLSYPYKISFKEYFQCSTQFDKRQLSLFPLEKQLTLF